MDKRFRVTDWLPTTAKEVKERGWDELDVVLFTGDAYVDHPSFGTAVISRIIEAEGFKIAIVPQPNWQDDLRDFRKMGTPKYFFAVSSGCMDSMVNHYTANKRLRSDDAYTAGGKAGFRPDYATITYSKILKRLFPDTPILIGGIEASLRRVTHFDYWSDTVKPSILVDSEADMLVYGMGEQPLKELLRLLKKGVPFSTIKNLKQTAYLQSKEETILPSKEWKDFALHSHETCLSDKKLYAQNFRYIEEESNKWEASRLLQEVGDKICVINPPYPPMTENELDASFDLPYTRLPHPKYDKKGEIPAYNMIKYSVNLHRGCFGGCSFCTISAHQGKFIASRSKESIMREVNEITKDPEFKGYLSDLGGPSANMYRMEGRDLSICKRCTRPSCIHPNVCHNLNTDHTPLLDIYESVNALPSIKKAFVGSGVRYDMLMNPLAKGEEKASHEKYTKELITKHVSGRLKVAPEHTSDQVLKMMRKPSFELFKKFAEQFKVINREAGLNQQLIPYFISSHPASEEKDMAHLAVETKALDFKLEQVQDFTPTPMTLSTEIFYSGYHPYTLEPIFTPRTKDEKLNQRMYFFWYKPEYRKPIEARLIKLNQKVLLQQLFDKKR